jgi:hypothetical protein
MNVKKAIWLLVLCALMLSACSSNPANGAPIESIAPAAKQSEATWPAQLMGELPVPKGTITDISKYLGTKYIAFDDTTTQPDMVIVTIENMNKEDATAYLRQLKNMGFTGGVEGDDGDKIVFSGSINYNGKNAVNFDYASSSGIAHITGSPNSGNK